MGPTNGRGLEDVGIDLVLVARKRSGGNHQQNRDRSCDTTRSMKHECESLGDDLALLLASEVAGVLGVTGSGVLGVFWICTEWAAAAGECVACGYDRIGLCAFFDPVHDSAEHVEMIERRATAAVRHPGNEENTAPRGNLLGASIGFSERFVIARVYREARTTDRCRHGRR